tara:strand:+ start:15063 stop:15281 length:219 start_codon:yes stop_codon:yes gene_type:complete
MSKTLEVLHINFAKIYRLGGVTFEWHNYFGAIILNRHTEKERQYENISLRNWSSISKFMNLSDEDREKHRIK